MSQEKIEDLLAATSWTLGLPSRLCIRRSWGNSFTDRKFSVSRGATSSAGACEQVALSRLHDEKLVLLSGNLPPESKLTTTARKRGYIHGGH